MGEVAELEVPETLHGLIAARLDGLAAEERRLLQDASVLGKTFTKEALAELSGRHGSPSSIRSSRVSCARRCSASRPTRARRSAASTGSCRISCAGWRTRRSLAATARHGISRLQSSSQQSFGAAEQEIVEVVAAHYLAAYEAQVDAADAAEIKAKACELLARAAERAGSLGALGEARRIYEQAAELADEPVERALLLEQASVKAQGAAEWEPAERAAIAALELLDPGRRAARGGARRRTARAHRVDQRAPGARATADGGGIRGGVDGRARRRHRSPGIPAWPARWPLQVSSNGASRRTSWRSGCRRRAASGDPGTRARGRRPCRPAQPAGRRRNSRSSVMRFGTRSRTISGSHAAASYGKLSDACCSGDRYGEALEALGEAVVVARRSGERSTELFALSETTYALTMTGRWDEAVAIFDDLPEEQLRANPNLASVLSGVLEVFLHRGRLERAREPLATFAYLERRPSGPAVYIGARAAVLHAEGALAEALEAGTEAAGFSDVPQAVKQGLVWAVESALALGEGDRAEALLTTVESRPPGLRSPFLEAQAQRFRARMSNDEAGFKSAAGGFREYGIPFWLAVTQLEHAEWLLQQSRGREATALFEEAHDTFVRLQATPWIDRADSLAPRLSGAEPVSA